MDFANVNSQIPGFSTKIVPDSLNTAFSIPQNQCYPETPCICIICLKTPKPDYVLSSRLDRASGDESRISFELTILHLAHPALIY